MPTPMQPSKPMTPAAALAAKATANLAAAGGAKPAPGQMSALDKIKAIGQGKDPNQEVGSTKGPGEKSFSIKTAQDPDGTIHVYAKNEQEAKQKYQQLGNPMGMANHAEEVQEQGMAEARKVNTKATRAELNKRTRKEDPIMQTKQDKESDEAWERLQQHIANKKKEGVEEGLSESVGGNYLYHATGGLKDILQSGAINSALGPQDATKAQTKLPTVSVTRDWGYASGSNAESQLGGISRGAVIVLDRNAVEQRYKTLGTSQSKETRGQTFPNAGDLKRGQSARSYDIDKSGTLTTADADAVFTKGTITSLGKPASRQEVGQQLGQAKQDYYKSKAGGEFEEAVVVPKGALPLKGTMVGFWVNPKSQLMKDPAIMNDPRRLDMVRPNQFVKAKQQGVAEGASNIGAQIKAAYQKIYNQGDDAVEFMYYDSPIFAQYWDEYEGDLDSIVAEVDPKELQIILDELESSIEDQNINEGKVKQRLDPSCWDGYKKQGTKIKGGVRVNNCVKEDELNEAGFRTPSDWLSKQMNKISAKGAAEIGWKHNYDEKFWDADKEEKNPFGNYRKSWTQKNKSGDHSSEESRAEPKFARSAVTKPYHIITLNDRKGDTVIMATSPAEAKAKWERKFGGTGDKILRVSKPREMEESMTTLKTTFEGIEESIASLLENFGLENGRDFYIDGTIHTLDEQVAQDILSVLADHDLPGQARVRQLDEGWAISLIGQGEELVENLTVGNDDIEIRHIGEGVVRVYVNNELAEQFDTGTAAFKYVKALQENLAEADDELMSALSAEAGEDLMKIDKITEGWSEWEEKKASYKKAGADVEGKEDDYTVTSKDGSRKRYQNTKTGRKVTSLPPVEGKGEVDNEGNKVKRGRGRPKKVRESLAAIQAMRKQVTEALAKIDRLPEAQRNTPQVQAMVDRLTETVRTAIARAK